MGNEAYHEDVQGIDSFRTIRKVQLSIIPAPSSSSEKILVPNSNNGKQWLLYLIIPSDCVKGVRSAPAGLTVHLLDRPGLNCMDVIIDAG